MLFAAVGLPVWAGYRLGVSRARVGKEPPRPPRPLVDSYDDVDRLRRRRWARRRGFAGFFVKQLTSFLVFVIAVALIDVMLFIGLSVHENDLVSEGSQLKITHAVDEGLTRAGAVAAAGGAGADAAEGDVGSADAGGETAAEGDAATAGGAASAGGAGADAGWELSQEARDTLDGVGAWAMLLDGAGQVLWEYHVPDDVPRSFTLNDVAVMARHTNVNEYYAAFWDRDDGLLVVGFPRDMFWTMRITYPATAIKRFPAYVAVFFGANAVLLFAYLLLLQRRTRSAIDPIDDALVALSRGRAVDLNLRGDLAEVGDSIARASEELRRKEQARALWIRGVSHDIRTPLSLIAGYADGIAENAALPDRTRSDAALIRAQSMRIKDLVYDLNIASRLEYDMQPLDVGMVSLPRLLRETVAEYLNETAFDRCEFDMEIAPEAVDLELDGDARLLRRAVRNLLQNAASHNPDGCTVLVSLAAVDARGGAGSRGAGACWARIAVRDDGCGLAADALAQLRWRLEAAVGRTDGAAPDGRGGAGDPARAGRAAAGDPVPAGRDVAGRMPAIRNAAPGAPVAPASFDEAFAVPGGRAAAGASSAPAVPAAYAEGAGSGSASASGACFPNASCADVPGAPARVAEPVAGGDAATHGLGLVLVAKIARAHRGTMQVDGEAGQGFSVTIDLPARHGERAVRAKPSR